jgi:hypothetical protein
MHQKEDPKMTLRDEFEAKMISWIGLHCDPLRCKAEWDRSSADESYLAEEIACAAEWLAQWPKTRTLNQKADSYGFKHRAEDWQRARGKSCYISNGALIMAAHRLGFAIEPADDFSGGFSNALLNLPAAAGVYVRPVVSREALPKGPRSTPLPLA